MRDKLRILLRFSTAGPSWWEQTHTQCSPCQNENPPRARFCPLALAAELGMRPLLARCYFGLGKLYRRTGKREQAREHLRTATTMYRDMGMGFWLERAETEPKELG